MSSCDDSEWRRRQADCNSFVEKWSLCQGTGAHLCCQFGTLCPIQRKLDNPELFQVTAARSMVFSGGRDTNIVNWDVQDGHLEQQRTLKGEYTLG